MVFSGEVIRRFQVEGASLRTTVNLPIPGPGWLAVRCFEPVTTTVRYAHSSPFYFTAGGKLPVRPEDARRWADYLNGLAKSLSVTDYPSPQAYRQAQATLAQAESVYRGLLRK